MEYHCISKSWPSLSPLFILVSRWQTDLFPGMTLHVPSRCPFSLILWRCVADTVSRNQQFCRSYPLMAHHYAHHVVRPWIGVCHLSTTRSRELLRECGYPLCLLFLFLLLLHKHNHPFPKIQIAQLFQPSVSLEQINFTFKSRLTEISPLQFQSIITSWMTVPALWSIVLRKL